MKLIGSSIVLSTLFLSMMAYMFYSANRMVTTYDSLSEASNELRAEATQAHFLFEKILAGNSGESIDTVWQHLNIADWYAKAMLEGGQKEGSTIIAVDNQAPRKEVKQVLIDLRRFRDITEQRYQAHSNSGLAIEQREGEIFQNVMSDTAHVEKKLHTKFQADLMDFRQTGMGLLTASVVLVLFITSILLKNRQRNIRQISKIQAAKQAIEESNNKLHALAHYDFLTNLPNRALLADLLKAAVAHAKRHRQSLVLFFIDLDHFKAVNDSFGHHAGDELLRQVAKRLNQQVRAEDVVARLSGDEFTLLLAPERTQQLALDSASIVVKKIQQTLAKCFLIEGTEVFISASIGIALYPKDGESAESILKNADRSMYDVKQMGKNNYRFFSTELGNSAQRKLQMESDLRKAIYDSELELYYQPQWNFKTGELCGLEALVRWNHPQQGLVYPDEFIAVAENSGLIYQLDMWVLEAACKQLRLWEREGLFSRQISINMSALQFSSSDLVENIVDLLEKYAVKPAQLEIEIVESILMQDSEHTLAALAALKNLGINIAVDDFGTGYSAMAYLSKFPIDSLKIDKAFISEIGNSVAAKVIVESIIKMATKLGLDIVAEGIETEEQGRFLAYHGCTFAQGYFYNKPMPVNDVAALLHVV